MALAALLGAGCGSAALDVQNPTGACGTRPNEGRAGYQSSGGVWVPDCESALLREYWRAFTDDGTTAYMLPRPDGAAELQPVCGDANHELRATVDRYGLCAAAATPAAVDVANHMALADALAVGHFLHTQLRFVTTTEGVGILPYPIPSDIIDACALDGGGGSADLQAMCQRERDRLSSGSTIGFAYTGPGAAELVARLNELYGIH